MFYFDSNFSEVFYQWSYQQWAIIGSDNDLVPNRHHSLDQWWHSLPMYVNVTLMEKLTSETWTVPAMAHVIICGVNTSWNNYHIGQLSFITGCPGPIIALNFTYLIHCWFYRKFPYKPIGNSYPPGAILSHYVQHPTDPVRMLPRTKNITKNLITKFPNWWEQWTVRIDQFQTGFAE